MTARMTGLMLCFVLLIGGGCSQDPEAWRSSGRSGAERPLAEVFQPPAYHSPIRWWRINHRDLVARNHRPDERFFSPGECRVCHAPENSCNACHDFIGIARIGD